MKTSMQSKLQLVKLYKWLDPNTSCEATAVLCELSTAVCNRRPYTCQQSYCKRTHIRMAKRMFYTTAEQFRLCEACERLRNRLLCATILHGIGYAGEYTGYTVEDYMASGGGCDSYAKEHAGKFGKNPKSLGERFSKREIVTGSSDLPRARVGKFFRHGWSQPDFSSTDLAIQVHRGTTIHSHLTAPPHHLYSLIDS